MATGQAFCGVVGKKKTRNEYTVMGDAVNLAARLMAHASKHQLGVLADVVTYRQSDDKLAKKASSTTVNRMVEYEVLEPVRMKGKADLIPIYKPLKMVLKGGVERKMIEHSGRAEELAILRNCLLYTSPSPRDS